MISLREKFGIWFGEKLQAIIPPPDPPKGDLSWLTAHSQCPDCQSKLWNSGPCGRMAMNIRCANCGAKFCFCGPFTPDRINNDDQLYNIGSAKTIEELTGWKPGGRF